jgi:transcriptional regulator with XRE-family HTH domain
VDDQRLGAAARAVRLRRGLRQQDIASLAGVSHATVSLLERGHCDTLSMATIRRIAGVIDIRVDMVGRWRGGDLDRLLNRKHSALAESVAASMQHAGWVVEPEVSFSIYGERGIVDQLAWYASSAHLIVVELKTQLVDINELLGTLDRKRRLARQIAKSRGWDPALVSVWLIVSDTCSNRRHARNHATLLRSRLEFDGRQFRKLLRQPTFAQSGLAFWADSNLGSTRPRPHGPNASKVRDGRGGSSRSGDPRRGGSGPSVGDGLSATSRDVARAVGEPES